MAENTTTRGLLLDLDGTIADSIPFFFELTCELLHEAGIEPPDRAEALAAISNGESATRFIPQDFPDRDAWVERTFRERWPVWSALYDQRVQPIPGACEAVGELAEAGYALAIVTSSSGELRVLERWGIRHHVTAIVSRDDVRHIKPHPEPMIAGATALGIEPTQLLAVGDTPLDVHSARGAGIPTIGVLTGAGTEEQLRSAGAEAILQNLGELPECLSERRR